MRVLCFTNSTYKYNQNQNAYYGGGWIDSLLTLLEQHDKIDLAVAFFHEKFQDKACINDVIYYPIYKASRRKNPFKTLIGDWQGKIEKENVNDEWIKVISDFKPDVIQVFGTEGPFSGIQRHTNIPVLVHLQGLLNPYMYTYYPINQSKWNFLFNRSYLIQNLLGKGPSFTAKRIRNKAKREFENFQSLKYVSGRTDWDKKVSEIFNTDISYFHIDEVLRPVFYEERPASKRYSENDTIQLVSTISPTIYKGMDVILKTAELLCQQADLRFNWKIIGLNADNPFVRHFEKSLGIKHSNVNIEFVGIKKAEDFIEELLFSNLYIHPSYIDNSPNSVCEAQILGLPVIACNVGGLSTIVENYKTGFLVPSNGIFELVHLVESYKENPELYKKIGIKAREKALHRHDRQRVLESLVKVYKKLSTNSDFIQNS